MISRDTDGFSGADLKSLCADVKMGHIRQMGPIRQLCASEMSMDAENVPPISYKHFRKSLRGMNPSVAQADLAIYEKWNDTYGNKCGKDYDDTESSDDDETPGV